MMNPALQQLKDIHLPSNIHMWPVAPGWIAIFLLLLISLIYLSHFLLKQRRRKHTVKFALVKLEKLQLLLLDNPENLNVAAEISTLLRRTALHYFPRDAVAGLSGDRWLQFLNQSGETTNFTQERGRLLIDAPYQKENAQDLGPLFMFAKEWLMTLSKKCGRQK